MVMKLSKNLAEALYLATSDDNDKMSMNSTNNLVVIRDWEHTAYVEFSIKHCPMCGGEL